MVDYLTQAGFESLQTDGNEWKLVSDWVKHIQKTETPWYALENGENACTKYAYFVIYPLRHRRLVLKGIVRHFESRLIYTLQFLYRLNQPDIRCW